ncbi:unnamed protein product [Cyprideis torosa]|uniref:Uncharacterized protein n=1 Tax=Cyprideis torosa TaxID=163714 RepID=A0A7R8WPI6_9CRUS|nr:unnamed protein product [Cyprideis torosa]CAG0906953.1 unnamed protein product [Cyprideis torosa]
MESVEDSNIESHSLKETVDEGKNNDIEKTMMKTSITELGKKPIREEFFEKQSYKETLPEGGKLERTVVKTKTLNRRYMKVKKGSFDGVKVDETIREMYKETFKAENPCKGATAKKTKGKKGNIAQKNASNKGKKSRKSS